MDRFWHVCVSQGVCFRNRASDFMHTHSQSQDFFRDVSSISARTCGQKSFRTHDERRKVPF